MATKEELNEYHKDFDKFITIVDHRAIVISGSVCQVAFTTLDLAREDWATMKEGILDNVRNIYNDAIEAAIAKEKASNV